MSDDSMLADLLGEAPASPDPGFRFDVFARVAERARRRAGMRRAATTVAVFAAIGAVFPLAAAAGITLEDVRPVLLLAGALASAYLLALVGIEGPRGALARSRAWLRAAAP